MRGTLLHGAPLCALHIGGSHSCYPAMRQNVLTKWCGRCGKELVRLAELRSPSMQRPFGPQSNAMLARKGRPVVCGRAFITAWVCMELAKVRPATRDSAAFVSEACWCAHAQDKKKPILFSMARLDRVKNLTGLAELYAKNERLRAACNLVIVGGIVDPSQVHSPVQGVGVCHNTNLALKLLVLAMIVVAMMSHLVPLRSYLETRELFFCTL